jgi:putative transposase
MSWYRRWRQPGGLYFFTVVSYGRRPILTSKAGRRELRGAIVQTRGERPWEIVATVLLPDHLHCLWRLPPGDDDYPTRWRLLKSRFTRALLAAGYAEPRAGVSRRRRQEHAVWQRRGWEHMFRDETDWKNHLDYIHYNPVKHGLVAAPRLWPYSTFAKYVQWGEYEPDWGNTQPENLARWLPPGGFIE